MRNTSLKRAAQLLEYDKGRRAYLREHPLCEVCKDRRSGEVHHQHGRQGKLLLEQKHFLAVCWTCHRKIHDEPKWAKEHGYRN